VRRGLAVTGLTRPFRLPDSLLIEGTDSVLLGATRLVREQDYQLDYIKGWIRFNQIPATSDTFHISYQIFPFKLRSSYFHPLLTIRPEEVER